MQPGTPDVGTQHTTDTRRPGQQPAALSGGQQQLNGSANAAHAQPDQSVHGAQSQSGQQQQQQQSKQPAHTAGAHGEGQVPRTVAARLAAGSQPGSAHTSQQHGQLADAADTRRDDGHDVRRRRRTLPRIQSADGVGRTGQRGSARRRVQPQRWLRGHDDGSGSGFVPFGRTRRENAFVPLPGPIVAQDEPAGNVPGRSQQQLSGDTS